MKKYIVITGASSGIGAATAKAFARRGENLIVIARRAELLENLKNMSKIEYIYSDGNNLGIAKALNLACEKAIIDKFNQIYLLKFTLPAQK